MKALTWQGNQNVQVTDAPDPKLEQATDAIEGRIGVGRKLEHELDEIDLAAPRQQLCELGTAFELAHRGQRQLGGIGARYTTRSTAELGYGITAAWVRLQF